ncbi:Late blight resistance protein R1-A, putative [Ricinus communis]|uniref:Late blight resistance protein R1-A, putative n=1 Tax=Ricinus communis TaxID=3988 RepID=B9SAE1_RICCO|nr:Late blight resistance protein R1-A, putative [Ricinus communis]
MAAENFGVSIGAKVAELLVEPVIHQFRYMFCFSNFIEDLKKQEEKLTLAQSRVQNDIDAALRNAEDIEKDVQAWLADTNKAMEDIKCLELEIQKEKRCFIKWCPNWIWQYRLSRRMAKKTTNLVQLQEKGKFQRVSYHATIPCIEFLSKDFMPSETSRLALEQIVESLRDDAVSMIGLHGMGGVGKTTLVKAVGKQANELKLFDKVLMLVVSQAQDIIQVQDQLADKLYLYLQEKSKDGRASRIWQRLKNEKNILIILDDVWKYLDLKDIGIPFGDDHKGCKILLTTRLQHVCTSMDCQRQIPLHVLTEGEAWALLKKNAGLSNESSALTNVAMEVARECKGLPIAIVTVGRALRDYDISTEELVGYAVGLGLYEDAHSIEEARSEVFESIGDLKASCMLLETEKEEHVKMHDTVRDFALWFGFNMENGLKLKAGIVLDELSRTEKLQFRAISLMDNGMRELAEGLNCPKLELLLLGRNGKRFSIEEDSSATEEGCTSADEGSANIPTTCFTGMQ